VTKRPYIKPGRLSDVLALIQVLALDEHTHRSLSGVGKELQGTPCSSDSWMTVAKEHPEFFRVRAEGEHILSLVARHVTPEDETGERKLPGELIRSLLQVAIDLRDREVSASEWWKSLIPLWAAIIGGAFGAGSTLFTLWLNGWCKP
jgi:hypothetical protein